MTSHVFSHQADSDDAEKEDEDADVAEGRNEMADETTLWELTETRDASKITVWTTVHDATILKEMLF
jgi:hypothetical protein